MRSTAIRFRSSGIDRSPLRRPASTCATGTAPAASAPASVEFVSPYTSTQSGSSRSTAAAIPGRIASGIGALQVEPVRRLREPELLEEDVGELSVVVLPGVEHDLVDPRRAQRDGHRARLDELRAVADDRENLHRHEATMAAASGR